MSGNERKMPGVALAFGLFLGMMLFVVLAGGCSLQGGSGRLAGVDLSLSLGENAGFVSTSRDETEAGRDITRRAPYPGHTQHSTREVGVEPTPERVPHPRQNGEREDQHGQSWNTRY